MIVENDVVQIERSTKVEPLTVGIKDPSIFLKILCTKLYENPLKVLVQEYMCNARDSHREFGNIDEPISVTLPTSLFPTLKITDVGVGISPDRVKNVFVFFGESTKTMTDEQTGGHGLGAKTAWAYTDSFTVRTIYENILYVYIVYIGDGNIGYMELLSSSNVEERNGTTIEIDIKPKDFDKVEQCVYATGFFWDVRPIITNATGNYEFGGPLHHFRLDNNFIVGSYINEISYTHKNHYLSHFKNKASMVVDGIIYKQISDTIEIPDDCKLMAGNDSAIFIHFKTSELKPAINRENVIINELYKNRIKGRLAEFISWLTHEIDNDTKDIKSLADFLTYIQSTNIEYLDIVQNWELYINGICVKYNKDKKFYIKLNSDYLSCHIYKYINHEMRFDGRTQYISLADIVAGNVILDDKFIKTLNKNAIKYYIDNIDTLFKQIKIITKYDDNIVRDDILREESNVIDFIKSSAPVITKLCDDFKNYLAPAPSSTATPVVKLGKSAIKVKVLDKHGKQKKWIDLYDIFNKYDYIIDLDTVPYDLVFKLNRLVSSYNNLDERKFLIISISKPTYKNITSDVSDKFISHTDAAKLIVDDIFARMTSHDFILLHQYQFEPEQYKYISRLESAHNNIIDDTFCNVYKMYNRVKRKINMATKLSTYKSSILRDIYELIKRYSDDYLREYNLPCKDDHIEKLFKRKSNIIAAKCNKLTKIYPLLTDVWQTHKYDYSTNPLPSVEYINAIYHYRAKELVNHGC